MLMLKAPRWVLITEAVVLVGALLVLACKAAMWVCPLGRFEQAQFLKKVDPAARIQEYYAQYHIERNHQALDNRPIDPGHEVGRTAGEVQCRERLGGILRYYHRKAA